MQENIERSAAKINRAAFPMLLAIRWTLVVILIAVGVQRLFILVGNWTYWMERVVIDPSYSPYPWLVVESCVLATAALLWMRSRWVFVPIVLHIGLFARQIYVGLAGHHIPWQAFEVWAAEVLVLGFCLWLLLLRRLR